MTATTTTALVPIQPAFSDAERLALAGYLAGYRGLTREAYALDLRQFTIWCRAHSLNLFAVRRANIEGFAREHLTRWAVDKFKRFRGRYAKAMAWLQEVYQYKPGLLAHWQLIAFTAGRTVGAG